jgi:hypothetical protein
MKSSKMMKSLAAMSLIISLYAVGSQATDYVLPAGSFTVLSCALGSGSQNPNGYPAVIVSTCQLTNCNAGFFLDGSEMTSNWLKMLQDAVVNNRKIGIHTDDNWSHALSGQISENGYTAGAYKIVAIKFVP